MILPRLQPYNNMEKGTTEDENLMIDAGMAYFMDVVRTYGTEVVKLRYGLKRLGAMP